MSKENVQFKFKYNDQGQFEAEKNNELLNDWGANFFDTFCAIEKEFMKAMDPLAGKYSSYKTLKL